MANAEIIRNITNNKNLNPKDLDDTLIRLFNNLEVVSKMTLIELFQEIDLNCQQNGKFDLKKLKILQESLQLYEKDFTNLICITKLGSFHQEIPIGELALYLENKNIIKSIFASITIKNLNKKLETMNSDL